jgi:hypothetical protein
MLSNLLPVSLAILVNLQLFLVETQWAQTTRVGSGTIIDPDGMILTCAHLVPDTESTKAVLSGKVINLTLPVSLGVYLELLITGRQYQYCRSLSSSNETIIMLEYEFPNVGISKSLQENLLSCSWVNAVSWM